MSFTYPMQLVDNDYYRAFGYLDKGHTDPEKFASYLAWSWDVTIDDLKNIKHLFARWLPPYPFGSNIHELQFVKGPEPGAFLCTFISCDHVSYLDDNIHVEGSVQ